MKRSVISSLVLSALITLGAVTSPAVRAERPDTEVRLNGAQHSPDPWWHHAVFYEIYPRSFADAKNTGMGNLAGITSKLDYLKSIGVGAIWITPCFPSPQVDFGYDISDYTAIAPEYGTMADFDKLMAEANKRNIKVCLDFVMNHTSDKHKWFVESRSSKTNPKRDWYVWRDGKNGQPPNNWISLFGHSAWQYDPKTMQYYYHFFYREQPDLNWRNPQVRTAMYDAAKFWLNKGVAGFRLDAVNTLYEDPKLADNPIVPGKKNHLGDPEMKNQNNYLLPEIHDALKELRAVFDTYPEDRVLIGETTDARSIKDLARMYGVNNDEIQLPMNFMFGFIDKLSAPEFRKQIAAADANPANGWPVYLFSNHDVRRAYDRYGDGKHNDQIAKLLATMLYTLRGTPILYYGEEIGMETTDPKRKEDVKDPIGKINWPQFKGRDGERTPMQWSAAQNAGFSTVTPWLPVGANYKTHNVESESKDPNSVLSFYRALADLRQTSDAVRNGSYASINDDDKNVLAYVRKSSGETIVIALNMSNVPQTFKYSGHAAPVVSTDRAQLGVKDVDLNSGVQLAPYGVWVGKLSSNG